MPMDGRRSDIVQNRYAFWAAVAIIFSDLEGENFKLRLVCSHEFLINFHGLLLENLKLWVRLFKLIELSEMFKLLKLADLVHVRMKL